MQQFRINEITFQLPERWDEVSTEQYLRYAKATTGRDRLIIMSGLTEHQLKPLSAPDIASVTQYLQFTQDLPDFDSMSSAATLTLGERIVGINKSIWKGTTLAQKWDLDDIVDGIITDVDAVSLHEVAQPLLSIYLSESVLDKLYPSTNDACRAFAAECWQQIKDLPCTTLMPIACALLHSHNNPEPSGRLVVSPVYTNDTLVGRLTHGGKMMMFWIGVFFKGFVPRGW